MNDIKDLTWIKRPETNWYSNFPYVGCKKCQKEFDSFREWEDHFNKTHKKK